MVDYNRTRTVQQLLAKTASSPPSFTIHLHLEHWVLNNGSKFTYHNQIASLLDDISNRRIPVDFLELFDQARVPFYDGCMIVELLDYRSDLSKEPPLKVPVKTRVVLHPNAETLWADICTVNQRLGGTMTDNDALELESKILLATAPPLCLDPDPHLTRIVNQVIRVSSPGVPVSLKRKARAMEPEEDGPEKAKRERFLSFMAPRDNRSHAPNYRLLDTVIAKRKADAAAPPAPNVYPTAGLPPPPQPQVHVQPPQALTPVASNTPADKLKKKGDTPQIPAYNVAFARSEGTHTPVPPRPTHQFVNQHPPATNGAPPVVPQGYPNTQAQADAAKRAATPAVSNLQQQQQQYILLQQRLAQQQQQNAQAAAQQQQNQPRPPSQPQLAPQQNMSNQPPLFNAPTSEPTAASPPNPQSQPQPQPPPSYVGTPKQFQANLPNVPFLQQPPPGIRGAQIKPPGPNGASQASPQPTAAHLQHLAAMMHQRNNMSSAQGAGRMTPQMQAQMQAQHQMQGPQQPQQGQQSQQPPQTPQQQGIGGAGSPSPVRQSPMVSNQAIQQANAMRASPIPGKNQITGPGQQAGPPQHPQQLAAQHQQNLANSLQMQRAGFSTPFNPHMRVGHGPGNQGSPAMTAAVTNGGTPSLAPSVAPSPRLSGNTRPITPAVSTGSGAGEMKMQPPQQPAQTPQMGTMQLPGQMFGPGGQTGQISGQMMGQAAQQMQRAQMSQQQAAQAQAQAQAAQAQAQAQAQGQAQGGQPQMPQGQQQSQPSQPQQFRPNNVANQASNALDGMYLAIKRQQQQQQQQAGNTNGGMNSGVNNLNMNMNMGMGGAGMGMSGVGVGGMGMNMNMNAGGMGGAPGQAPGPGQGQVGVPPELQSILRTAVQSNLPPQTVRQMIVNFAPGMPPQQVTNLAMKVMQFQQARLQQAQQQVQQQVQQHQRQQQQQQQQQQSDAQAMMAGAGAGGGMPGGMPGGMGGNMGANMGGGMGGMGFGNLGMNMGMGGAGVGVGGVGMGGGQPGQPQGLSQGPGGMMFNGRPVTQEHLALLQQQMRQQQAMQAHQAQAQAHAQAQAQGGGGQAPQFGNANQLQQNQAYMVQMQMAKAMQAAKMQQQQQPGKR